MLFFLIACKITDFKKHLVPDIQYSGRNCYLLFQKYCRSFSEEFLQILTVESFIKISCLNNIHFTSGLFVKSVKKMLYCLEIYKKYYNSCAFAL